MENVWLFLFVPGQTQPVETGIRKGAVVVTGLIAGERGHRLNSYTKEIVSERLEERQSFGHKVTVLREVFLIADFFQRNEFLLAGKPRKIVYFLRIHPSDFFLHGIGEWRLGQKLGPRRRVHAGDQAVFPESFLIEESRGAALGVKLRVISLVESLRINAEFFQKLFRFRAVTAGAFDGLRAAVGEHHAAPDLEFVALGVSSEIVVIIKDKNFDRLAGFLPEAVSSRQATDSSTNDDQIVRFGGVFGCAERGGRFAVTHPVSKSKRAIVIAADAGARGRVI